MTTLIHTTAFVAAGLFSIPLFAQQNTSSNAPLEQELCRLVAEELGHLSTTVAVTCRVESFVQASSGSGASLIMLGQPRCQLMLLVEVVRGSDGALVWSGSVASSSRVTVTEAMEDVAERISEHVGTSIARRAPNKTAAEIADNDRPALH